MKNMPKLALVLAVVTVWTTLPAQTVTDPNPNAVVSWNFDNNSTVNPTDLAGLAPAINWVDSWLNNVTANLPDNTGTATTLSFDPNYSANWGGYGPTWWSYSIAGHPGYDANGTANREMLNGYLNTGPATWNTATNSFIALTNIPYALYDVVVYFSSDTSGRHGSIDNGTTTYYFSTMGSAEVNGANAKFLPTTQTNSAIFPSADFAFFPGMTNAHAVFTEMPKSGNDQWLGIAAFQVIQASNAYVLYGPTPASQIVSAGQPVTFNVIAGGLNPRYQWQHAGTNLLNATNATYVIASTVVGQEGNYSVIVSNGFNSITSAVATLTFYAPKTDTWIGGTGSAWDFGSLNWTANGNLATTNYADTDNVRFDPLGAAQASVSLAGTVTPGSITVSNASYLFAGGSLDGAGAMHLMNNATLILDTVDTRSGPTVIDNGSTLQLDNGDTAGSFGSGALTNNGTLLFNSSGAEAYGYPVYGTGNITNLGPGGTITLGNTINANHLVQAGAGVLLLQGSNSLAGGLMVSSGVVWARSESCLGKSQVVLAGGELQLVYGFDYAGSSLTLAGGLLHSAGAIFEGPVTLAANSEIDADSGTSLTLANAQGIAGAGYDLTLGGGGGTLILAGTNNAWNSLTINAGTVAFNSAANLVVTSSISGGGNLSQTGAGTLALTGDLGLLSGVTTVSAGTLGGNSTLGGALNVLAGGTLAPGTSAAIGTLTVNGGLTLGGNVLVKLNKSLTQTSDLVAVPGGVSNTNNGVVIVNNLGPALVAGNSFQLFSQPVTGGETLTISNVSGNVVWTNMLATDGTITVLSVGSAIAAYPTNISFSAGAGQLSLTWPATHLGWILQAQTNGLGTGLTTNWVDVPGTAAVTVTNLPVGAVNPTVFFRLRHP